MSDFDRMLTGAARRFGVRKIAGALITKGEIQFSEARQTGFDCDTPQPIFCLAKVLTATLIAQAIQNGLLSMDVSLGELFDCKRLKDDSARRVTIFHLLGHMHGWENASAPAGRRDESGFLAPGAILDDLNRRPRLYEPGEMYSYDAAGYLLLGAILEKIHHARFDEILRRFLLDPLGMTGAEAAAHACPAGDGLGISLTVRDLSRFAAFHLPGGPEAARLLAPRVLDAPGWSPFYQGTSLAWRHLGGGWLSHEGVGFQGSPYSMVRLNPAENLCLILISPEARSRLLGAQLFSDISRASLTTDFALPLSGDALGAFDATSLCGVYTNGDSRTTIYRDDQGPLRGRFATGGSRECQERTLQPATRDVLFLNASLGRRHFIQPLRTRGTSEITHLWDGYEVARRMA